MKIQVYPNKYAQATKIIHRATGRFLKIRFKEHTGSIGNNKGGAAFATP